MPSPAVLDFDKLLKPIPGDAATGRDLRKDPPAPDAVYYLIKDARTTARAAERQQEKAENPQDVSPPDWRPVLQRGTKALVESTKDLEVVAYMTEALLRLHSFAGLRDGFRLARELAEKFWDGLYPEPEDEGPARRIAPIVGLNGDDAEGTLLRPLKLVPLTASPGGANFSLAQYEDAAAIKSIADAKVRERRLAQAGAVSLEMIEKSAADTPAEFFRQLFDDLKECAAQYASLCAALEKRCEGVPVPSSSVRGLLESCSATVKVLAKGKLEAPPVKKADAKEPAPAGGAATEPAAEGKDFRDTIRTREEAFRSLLKVAEFFRQTEPHTVVSYALEQVVRWGQMPLPDLLNELIPEEAPRKNLFKQVGIRPPEAPKGDGAKK